MKMFKITNVTNLATGSRGFFLDVGKEAGGHLINIGKHLIMEAKSLEMLPAIIQKWAAKGWIRIHEVEKGEQVAGLTQGQEITAKAITPVREMNSDDISEEEPSLADAFEAKLTTEVTAPIDQPNSQTVKISEAAAEERYSTDISPIPGDKPRDLGDAAKFTVKAPRTKHQGSIVKP
jgi:hypothetical protein